MEVLLNIFSRMWIWCHISVISSVAALLFKKKLTAALELYRLSQLFYIGLEGNRTQRPIFRTEHTLSSFYSDNLIDSQRES
jgi:hypothetical protein